MPRVYDSDFDDTPPPSPKGGSSNPTQTWRRSLSVRFRRSRALIYISIAIFCIFYVWNHIPHPIFKPKHAPSLSYKDVDWRQFAYSQYVTDTSYLCNAVMVFETLNRLGSKAQRLLLYPDTLDTFIKNGRDRDSQLLVKARDWYGVQLIPVPIQAMVKEGTHIYNSILSDMY